MFYPKKIQLWLALLSLLSLSLVKPAGLTEMPTLARNFNVSDMSSSGIMSTEEVVGSCVLSIIIINYKWGNQLYFLLLNSSFAIARFCDEAFDFRVNFTHYDY